MDRQVMEQVLAEKWSGTIQAGRHLATIRNEHREVVADVFGVTPEQTGARVALFGRAPEMARLLQGAAKHGREWNPIDEVAYCRWCGRHEDVVPPHNAGCLIEGAEGILRDLGLQEAPR